MTRELRHGAKASVLGVEEKDRVFARCARRLIPFMVLLYTVGYLDRVNVGFAALTMNKDMAFSPTVFGIGAGVFFLGYFFFQVPANVILQKVGARRSVFWILVTWGVVSAATALVQGPLSFYLLRFLLGLAEAGFFPGMVLYLSYWFPQAYRARYTAAFMTAVPLASIIGGPVSGLILGADGVAGLHGWQWLFLIEGLPACLLAFAALGMLPDGPAAVSWLAPSEKEWIAASLAADKTVTDRALGPALRDSRVLALCLAAFGIGFGGYGIGLWLPQILQGMGFTNLQTGLTVALLFAFGMAAMVLWGRSSDARGERIRHVALPLFLASAGLLAVSFVQSGAFALLALTIVTVGFLAVDGPFFSLPSSFLGGPAFAGGVALINAVGSLGAFAGPIVVGVLKEKTGTYAASMTALAAVLVLAALIVLLLGRKMAPPKVPDA